MLECAIGESEKVEKEYITHFSYKTISGSHIVSDGTLMAVMPP